MRLGGGAGQVPSGGVLLVPGVGAQGAGLGGLAPRVGVLSLRGALVHARFTHLVARALHVAMACVHAGLMHLLASLPAIRARLLAIHVGRSGVLARLPPVLPGGVQVVRLDGDGDTFCLSPTTEQTKASKCPRSGSVLSPEAHNLDQLER